MLSDLQITYFLSVAETGNIAESAKRAYVSAPAVSRQILAAEKTLGFPLFERTSHGVRLLPAGEKIRDVLIANRQLFDEVAHTLQTQTVSPAPELRFGLPLDWFPFSMLTALQTCLAEVQTKLTISSAPPEELLHLLADGALDLVIAPSGATNVTASLPLEHRLLFKDRLVALYSAGWQLAQFHPKDLTALAPYPLLHASYSSHSLLPQLSSAVCSRWNFEPKIEELSNYASVLTAVGAGLGWCLASRFSWAAHDAHYASILLDEPNHVFAFWASGRTHAAVPLGIECLEREFDKLYLR